MKLLPRFEFLDHEQYYLCYEFFEDTEEKMVFVGQFDKDEDELVGTLLEHPSIYNEKSWAIYHKNDGNCNVQVIFELDDLELIMHIVPEIL
jgi:hypothetical protein